MKCPVHSAPHVGKRTRFGMRYGCEEEGCTVVCWGSETSTPADQATRDARHKCHEAFDPLWRDKKRWRKRGHAYRWLADTMGLHIADAHIGMFSMEQCQRLLTEIERLGATI